MQNTLTRRGFLTAMTATAAAGLAGCAQIRGDMPVIKVDDYGNPLRPGTDVDPALGSYEAMYSAREDGGFQLPAIPVKKMDPRYLRQIVRDPTGEQPGTIVVDTNTKFLYLVRENGGLTVFITNRTTGKQRRVVTSHTVIDTVVWQP